MDTFKPDDMVMPLCVLDLSKEVSQNPDFTVTVDDILAWEEKNGKICLTEYGIDISNYVLAQFLED